MEIDLTEFIRQLQEIKDSYPAELSPVVTLGECLVWARPLDDDGGYYPPDKGVAMKHGYVGSNAFVFED